MVKYEGIGGWMEVSDSTQESRCGPTGSRKFLSWSYVEGSVLQELFWKGG